MKFLSHHLFLIVAITSLALGFGGIYSTWYAKYEIPTQDVATEPNYATKTNGTIIEEDSSKEVYEEQRRSQLVMAFLLGVLGFISGCYLIIRDYKWGMIGGAASIVAIILSIAMMSTAQ